MTDGSGAARSYTGGVGSRREARERAFALLYEAETKGCSIGELVTSLPLPPEPFTTELLAGVEAHQDEIDAVLRDHARDWTLERMAALDRAVLRLGTYELLWGADTPVGVVISEAVELAKQYSTDESGRFVNGMLSAIAERDDAASAATRPADDPESGDERS